MFHRRSTLGQLTEELRTIEVFDRIYDFSATTDSANVSAHANRQFRRNQIIAEMGELKVSKPVQESSRWLSTTIALLCGVGWALFYYYLLN